MAKLVNIPAIQYLQQINHTSIFMHGKIRVESGTGEVIAHEIQNCLKSRNVDISKVMGFGSDGATAMTGKDKDCTGRLLLKNPMMINYHCLAHISSVLDFVCNYFPRSTFYSHISYEVCAWNECVGIDTPGINN
jgi:hypothetical protein